MLVLSRKQEEQIRIGDQIVVTVLRIKGNTVKIGIDAPRSVRVLRTELPLNIDAAETHENDTATSEPAVVAPAPDRVARATRRKGPAAPLGRYEAVIAQAIAK